MKPRAIYFADLTHTAQGITAATFPLGISFVASAAKSALEGDYAFELFKFPDELNRRLREEIPAILCLSSYSWNFRLAYAFAREIKKGYPHVVTVFGGPNFPVNADEKLAFLRQFPAIDFYVEMEGETGFTQVARQLEAFGYDLAKLKGHAIPLSNTSYLSSETLISGPTQRILDLNAIPSPYLSGLLDPFFELPLAPMFETTRGCPFSCTFCADGAMIKSKVRRFDPERVVEELKYLAKRTRKSDELIITDLNFGMFEEDLVTCEAIARLQQDCHWPVLVKASAGKNKPERVIEAAKLLKGTWLIGSAIQSSDAEVLKAVKRGNISTEAFTSFIDYGNSLSEDALTYTDIILGLPEDTKEKHFESLKYSVDRRVNSLRMYQTVVLMGTALADPASRRQYGLETMFRVLPGCVGIYPILEAQAPVTEIEEIIVGHKALPFDDYIACRQMNLVIETFYNNALFEEVFALLRVKGISPFRALLALHANRSWRAPRVQAIFDSFLEQSHDLFAGAEELERAVLEPAVVEKYVAGELGINELLVHKARLYLEMDEITGLLFRAVRGALEAEGRYTPLLGDYLEELQQFVLHRKRNILETGITSEVELTFDFESLVAKRFNVDPETLPRRRPASYHFFHDPLQKKHIASQYSLYANTPTGLGRFIQRSNLKMMYRRFEVPEALPLSRENGRSVYDPSRKYQA